MAFPADVLPLVAQMRIGGTWTTITSRVRGNNDSVIITRGARNEQGDSITPAQCNFKLNNRDFYFSDRNPSSTNYGLLPVNTQIRFSLTDPHGNAFAPVNGYPYDYVFGDSDEEYVSTTDKAVLDITGDIDVRVDLDPDPYPGGGLTGYMLASKYNTVGDQRSWVLTLRYDGTLRFQWSSTGAAGGIVSATSTAAVDFAGGRKAVRATLDVNNGAGGKTVTFYTSDTIGGSWTMLGSAVTTAGTTSIFSSTATLQIGTVINSDGGVTAFSDAQLPFRGRIYRAQVYNGIGGTLVADANFGSRSVGDTSWSDGLGTPNTWTVTATYGGITSGRYRFWGEIAELPQKADPSGTDLYVPTVATDIVRRLTQGQSPLPSPLYRYYSRFSTATQWHPLETGVTTSGTTGTVGSAISAPAARYNDITFSTDSTLPGAAGVATFNSANSYVTAYANSSANATYESFMFAFQFPSTPGAEVTMVSLGSTGTVRRWTIGCTATTFILRGYGADGTETGNLATTFGTNVLPTDWLLMRLQVRNSGANLIAEMAWCKVADTIVWGFTSTTEFPGTTAGRFTGYNFAATSGLNGFKLTQVMIAQEEIPTGDYDFYSAAGGYDGERAGKRAIRTANAAGVPLVISGNPDDTIEMGPETPATLIANLEECAKVDGGFLTTRRDAPIFYFVTRASLLDQSAVTLDHDDRPFVSELDPTDDDAVLRNQVTLTSSAGQSATSVRSTGRRGTATVGKYDSAYPLNGYQDALQYLAEHATYLGTWDEVRLPKFSVDLARQVFATDTALTEAVRALDIGGAVKIANPPTWFPPDDLEVMVRGYREVMSNKVHSFDFHCQNYGPLRAINNLSEQSDVPARAAATSSTLAGGTLNTTDLSFSVATASGALWTTSAGNFPMNVRMNGEVITLSGISGASSPQTFTASARSVNGVTRSHAVGSSIDVDDEFYAAL